MGRRIDYQKEIWKLPCPLPKCGRKGKGKMIVCARVKKTPDGERHAEVVCGGCGSHLMLHFRVAE